jgi:excisionase family DNA binding protein
VETGDRLLTPGEVAALFRVDPKTVTRWAAAGRIGSIRTPGGHRRFRESEVRALLEGELGELDEEEAGGRPGPASGNTGGHAGGGAGAPSGRGSNSGSHGNPGQGSAVAHNPGHGGPGAPVSTRPLGAPGPPGMH